MSNKPSTRSDVIIIGGGPVGTALAIDLAQRGVDFQVIERRLEPQAIPKGQNLTQRTMEYLAALGVESSVRERRTVSASSAGGGMTVYGTLLGPYRYDWLKRAAVARFYHRSNERLPQWATEAALRERLHELGGRTSFGWTARLVSNDDGGVTISSTSSTGEIVESSARYAIACDGGSSRIRESARIDQDRVDADRTMALVVLRSPELDALVKPLGDRLHFTVLQPQHHGYWQFFGRIDDDSGWFFHAPVPVGSTVETLDVPGLIAEAVGQRVEVEVRYVGFWDLKFAVARNYRSHSVLVAGDAAHSHPPYGGYGINTGFEDVANLAWKLELALATGHEDVLDSYDLERRPVFESTARDFIARSINDDRDFLAEFDPDRDRPAFEKRWAERQDEAQAEVDLYEPNYEGSPLIASHGPGGPTALGGHRIEARPGHHLAPSGVEGSRIFEKLGAGFTLLSVAPGGDRLRNAAARMGIDLLQLTLSAEESDAYGARSILIRPDRYVAWAGDELDERELASAVGAKDADSAAK